MVKMRRSELKMLIKECLQEILQEQINPGMLQEQLGLAMPQQMMLPAQAGMQVPMVNPYDNHQMQMRQEVQSQRMMQVQMQRQAMMHGQQGPSGQQLVGLSELAGLGPQGVMNEAADQSQNGGQKYNTQMGSGYSNPVDYLRMAQQQNPYGPPQQQNRQYNSHLDTPVGGSQPPQRHPQQQYHQQQPAFGLDPDLDTPVGGGEMRAPDPDVMRDIMQDTMMTTYQTQAATGHSRPGAVDGGGGGMGYAPPADKFAAAVSQHNPEDMFEGAGNWAALAFK